MDTDETPKVEPTYGDVERAETACSRGRTVCPSVPLQEMTTTYDSTRPPTTTTTASSRTSSRCRRRCLPSPSTAHPHRKARRPSARRRPATPSYAKTTATSSVWRNAVSAAETQDARRRGDALTRRPLPDRYGSSSTSCSCARKATTAPDATPADSNRQHPSTARHDPTSTSSCAQSATRLPASPSSTKAQFCRARRDEALRGSPAAHITVRAVAVTLDPPAGDAVIAYYRALPGRALPQCGRPDCSADRVAVAVAEILRVAALPIGGARVSGFEHAACACAGAAKAAATSCTPSPRRPHPMRPRARRVRRRRRASVRTPTNGRRLQRLPPHRRRLDAARDRTSRTRRAPAAVTRPPTHRKHRHRHAASMARPSMSTCRSCRAPIEWALTEYGRKMPLDVGTYGDGRVVVVGRANAGLTPIVVTLGIDTLERADSLGGRELRRSHFQTCPDSSEHRRR